MPLQSKPIHNTFVKSFYYEVSNMLPNEGTCSLTAASMLKIGSANHGMWAWQKLVYTENSRTFPLISAVRQRPVSVSTYRPPCRRDVQDGSLR